MGDFYGDKGSCKYPKIEEIVTLFFKLNGKIENYLSKNKQQEIVDKIKNLNIGTVEICKVQSLGIYIVITPYKICVVSFYTFKGIKSKIDKIDKEL